MYDHIDLTARASRGLFHTLSMFGCLEGLPDEKLGRLEEHLVRALCLFREAVREADRDEYLQVMNSHLLDHGNYLVDGSEN